MLSHGLHMLENNQTVTIEELPTDSQNTYHLKTECGLNTVFTALDKNIKVLPNGVFFFQKLDDKENDCSAFSWLGASKIFQLDEKINTESSQILNTTLTSTNIVISSEDNKTLFFCNIVKNQSNLYSEKKNEIQSYNIEVRPEDLEMETIEEKKSNIAPSSPMRFFNNPNDSFQSLYQGVMTVNKTVAEIQARNKEIFDYELQTRKHRTEIKKWQSRAFQSYSFKTLYKQNNDDVTIKDFVVINTSLHPSIAIYLSTGEIQLAKIINNELQIYNKLEGFKPDLKTKILFSHNENLLINYNRNVCRTWQLNSPNLNPKTVNLNQNIESVKIAPSGNFLVGLYKTENAPHSKFIIYDIKNNFKEYGYNHSKGQKFFDITIDNNDKATLLLSDNRLINIGSLNNLIQAIQSEADLIELDKTIHQLKSNANRPAGCTGPTGCLVM